MTTDTIARRFNSDMIIRAATSETGSGWNEATSEHPYIKRSILYATSTSDFQRIDHRNVVIYFHPTAAVRLSKVPEILTILRLHPEAVTEFAVTEHESVTLPAKIIGFSVAIILEPPGLTPEEYGDSCSFWLRPESDESGRVLLIINKIFGIPCQAT